ncbi:MAG: hypothetical protein ACQEW0_01915 [Pseudomonadota bacterium]
MFSLLFLVPSKLDGPSARYVMDLSRQLINFDNQVIISSESEDSIIELTPEAAIRNVMLPKVTSKESLNEYFSSFSELHIDFVFCIGSRINTDIVSLHFKRLGVGLVKQFEDDEKTIFNNCNPNVLGDSYDDLIAKGVNSKSSLVDISNLKTSNFKVIDPFFKGMTLRVADGYCKIWKGLQYDEERYLEGKKSFSLPPVCSPNLIEELKASANKAYDEELFFVAGTIYSVDDARFFLEAWKSFQSENISAKLIISRSRTSPKVIEVIEKEYNGNSNISLRSLPTDKDYQEVLMCSSFVVSVGGGEFDRKRLPSRLVKSMFLGKIILVPEVGFGKSLTDMENAIICSENSSSMWHKTLKKAYSNRKNTHLRRLSQDFAKANFDAINVAENLLGYLRDLERSSDCERYIDAEHCLKVDYLSLLNNESVLNASPKVKNIRFRLVAVSGFLIIQTLNRPDYSYQVDVTAQGIANATNGHSKILDSGFVDVGIASEINILGSNILSALTLNELRYLFKSFRTTYTSCSIKKRSRLFSKALISFRLFKLMRTLVSKFQIKNIIFHADMQSTEALISSWFGLFHPEIITYTMQHAMFRKVSSSRDVNVANYTVSPSKYSIFWDKNTMDLVCDFNPHKQALLTAPLPSFALSKIDHNSTPKGCLVILEGPDKKITNDELINLACKISENGKFGDVFVKPHPYHNLKALNTELEGSAVKLISNLKCKYNVVIFSVSTLGYEFLRYGYLVFQYTTDYKVINEAEAECQPIPFKNFDELIEKSKKGVTRSLKIDESQFLKEYESSLKVCLEEVLGQHNGF